MLQIIRDHAQGVIVWIIVGLIIITFALFGLSSYLSGSSKSYVADVNGVEIDENEFRREYQNYQARLEQMLGKNYRPDMFNSSMVKNEVINKLVTRELITQYLDEQAFHISQGRIFQELKGIEAFKNDKGQFDPQRYKDLIRQQGMPEAAFEQQVARDITARYLQTGVSQTEFATKHEAETKVKLDNQQRDIGYLTISKSAYLHGAKASDAEVEAYYNSHQNEFMTTEQVSVEYVELKLNEIAKRYEVSDKAIRDHYESQRLNYIENPEKRKVRHILVKVDQKTNEQDALKKIQQVQQELKSGKSFAEMAKKFSQDPGSAKQGGDLGMFGRGVMDKAFEKSAFSLKKGEVSKPVRSSFGYHLIKVDKIQAETVKPFKDVREQIKHDLQIQQAEQTFYADADQLNNISYEQPDSLQPVVDKLGLQIKSTGMFARSGGTGIAANAKVIAAAFSPDVISSGRNSDVLEISDTHLLVLRRKEHRPAVQKPMPVVAAQIQLKLKTQSASIKANENTLLALQRLQKGESPKKVASSIKGAKWHKVGLIARNPSFDKAADAKKLDNEIRRFSFTMASPAEKQPTWGRSTTGGGDGVVVGLYDVKQPADASDSAKLQQEQQRIAQTQGNAMFGQLLQHLRQEAKVAINLPKEDTQ